MLKADMAADASPLARLSKGAAAGKSGPARLGARSVAPRTWSGLPEAEQQELLVSAGLAAADADLSEGSLPRLSKGAAAGKSGPARLGTRSVVAKPRTSSGPSPPASPPALETNAAPRKMTVHGGPSKVQGREWHASLEAQMQEQQAAEHLRLRDDEAEAAARNAHPLIRTLLLVRLEALADSEAIEETVQRIQTPAAQVVLSSLLRACTTTNPSGEPINDEAKRCASGGANGGARAAARVVARGRRREWWRAGGGASGGPGASERCDTT